MLPKYTVYISRWEVYRIDHVEARSQEEAEERGREQFEERTGKDYVDGGYDSVEAELEEE